MNCVCFPTFKHVDEDMVQITHHVLQKNHRLLVNTLDLSSSTVLDKLHEDEIISSGEQEDILRRHTSREQNSRLLFLLKRRDPSALQAFINALKSEYGFIVDKIDLTQENRNPEKEENTCVHCMLLRNLLPNDVTHYLFEEEVITDDDLEELNNSAVGRIERVKRLLKLLHEHPNRKFVEEKFVASLKPKYTYILDSEVQITAEHFSSCRCENINGHTLKRYSDSCRPAEENRVQQYPVENTLSINTWQNTSNQCETYAKHFQQNSINKDKLSLRSVQGDISALKLDEAHAIQKDKAYDQVDASCILIQRNVISDNKQFNTATHTAAIDEFSPCRNDDIVSTEQLSLGIRSAELPNTRHSKEKHKAKNRKHKVPANQDLNKSEVVNTFAETPKDKALSKPLSHPHRVLPNDKKLMKMCKRLWDQLFALREKGEWDTFSLVTSRAFEKFADNPDIQVLLFRSEMCVSTFYKNDEQKALKMYEHALDLVPKTTMPTWHLARILPLKVALCTQAKRFQEASDLLEQAHQAMTLLAPCLSSGAVFFFEALYLSAFLRCSRSGTKATASLAEKVKTCFLTAISHYQQEPYFAIESFLNQVYLFLALFALGVDCKSVRYIGLQTVEEEDIALAEHYLHKFENSYWDKSTTWSRMLFFIGRGEQHKLRQSLRRSLDYFRDARDCALSGGFVEHLSFINENVQLVSDKLEERLRFEELNSKSADAILNSIMQSSDESGSSEN